jgi:hypothetical protein
MKKRRRWLNETTGNISNARPRISRQRNMNDAGNRIFFKIYISIPSPLVVKVISGFWAAMCVKTLFEHVAVAYYAHAHVHKHIPSRSI